MKFTITDGTAGYLPLLDGVRSLGGVNGSFEIFWNTDTSYPEQQVELSYRTADNSGNFINPNISTTRDYGAYRVVNVQQDTVFTVWIRAVVPGHYGMWQYIKATSTDGVISGYTDLVHNDEAIVHAGEEVIVPLEEA